MSEKLSKLTEKPEYARPLGKFEPVVATAPVKVGDLTLTLADVKELDRDVPAQPRGPIIVNEDALGAADPVRDISEHISYRFYQCTHPSCNMGKNNKPYRTFAGSGDEALERECDCIPEPRKLKGYQNPRISAEQFEHGVMKLYEYRALRNPAKV